MKPILFVAALALAAAYLSSEQTPKEQVGPLPNGGFLLNSGWRIQPVGRQIPLGTMPMSTARATTPSRPIMDTTSSGRMLPRRCKCTARMRMIG